MYMFTEIVITGYTTGESGPDTILAYITIGVRCLIFITYFLTTIESMFLSVWADTGL